MGIITGALVAGVAGSAISASSQKSAAKSASSAQTAAANAQIEAQKEALAESRALLQPYVDAGNAAMMAQMDLLGLGGYYNPATQQLPPAVAQTMQTVEQSTPGFMDRVFGDFRSIVSQGTPFDGSKLVGARPEQTQLQTGTMDQGATQRQQYSVDQIANDPLFLAKVRQGEEAMLQNASATGGLRGGNIQGALAQYRPQMLNQEIEQRLNRLSSISSLGQNAAAGVGNVISGTTSGITNALGQIGSAQAGAALASGQSTANMMGGITGGLQNYAMLQGLGLLGGGTSGSFGSALGQF